VNKRELTIPREKRKAEKQPGIIIPGFFVTLE
jgi:hypothetical protein